MHLTILSQYYPPEIGAPQTRLSELAGHFITRGHRVTVLTAMPNYPLGYIYEGYGGLLKKRHYNRLKVFHTFIYPTQKASFPARMTNYVSFAFSSAVFGSVLLDPSDYLLVESPPLFTGLPGIWLSKMKRARLIFNVSDLWPESAVRLGILRSEGPTYRVSLWLERFCYRHSWLISGQSKSILTDISQRFPDRATFHLSNGVDTNRFHPDRATDKFRACFHGERKSVVLYAGLHGLAQGLEQLLTAAAALTKDKEVQFALVGEGPEKSSLANRARQLNLRNVEFIGPKPASEIPAIVAAADIVVVPLKTYIPGAIPSKLYEAMASARPVVLIAEGEAADIVREHEAGIVVKPGQIEDLICAIRRLHEQPSLRRKLGENGRRAAQQHFDRAKIASRFIDHLEANL